MIEILGDIGYIFLLINLILFVKGFSKQGKAFGFFTFYLLFIFVIQITSSIFFYLKMNNLHLSHFYFIGQFIILSFFYAAILKSNQNKIIKVFTTLGLIVLTFQYSTIPNLFYAFNLFEIFITSFLLIIYATFHLYNLLNQQKKFYYVNLGILIYLFGSTILFLVGNLMTYLSPVLNKYTWILNSALYIVYQIFILIEWKKSFFRNSIISK